MEMNQQLRFTFLSIFNHCSYLTAIMRINNYKRSTKTCCIVQSFYFTSMYLFPYP